MGPLFNAGNEEPSEVKMALVDRSMSLFVRTLGDTSRPTEEFKQHLQNPEVKRKLKMFRILTCLMGLVRMILAHVDVKLLGHLAAKAPLGKHADSSTQGPRKKKSSPEREISGRFVEVSFAGEVCNREKKMLFSARFFLKFE